MIYQVQVKKDGTVYDIKYVHIYENRVTGLELTTQNAYIDSNLSELAAINTYVIENGYEKVYSFHGCINQSDPIWKRRKYGMIDRYMSVTKFDERPELVTINVYIGFKPEEINN